MTALPSFLRDGAAPRTLCKGGGKWPFNVLLAKRHGMRICCWCGESLPKGRKSWCSDACVEDYRSKHDWMHIRGLVYKRDKGICVHCRCDTKKVQRVFRHAISAAKRLRLSVMSIFETMKELGFLSDIWIDQWQANHINPRNEGGPNSLENLETACVPCHKEITKKYVQELAARRRKSKPSPLFEAAK